LALLLAADRINPLPDGLTGRYFRTAAGPPVHTRVDPVPSTDSVLQAWADNPPETFVVTWNGTILIPRTGVYTFSIDADHTGALAVDGRPVAESVSLARGIHPLFVQYSHEGGAVRFQLLSAERGEPLEPVPSWRLHPHKANGLVTTAGVTLKYLLFTAEWAWAALLLSAGASCLWWLWALARPAVERGAAWPMLRWILIGAFVLNGAALWWGLPAQWAADELGLGTLQDSLAQHFSHGWFDRWPPVHYYVLSIVTSPVLLLDAMGRIDVHADLWASVATLLSRLVSLAASLGILIAACILGTHVFGRRAGVLAAAILACAAPFVYYAKTANLDVPYLFWFAASLVFYIRLLDDGGLADAVLFAATATLAICTKDQAYSLYLLTPFVIILRFSETGRARGHAWWQVFVDARLLAAGATATLVFALAHNLLFNFGGFLAHVRYVTGPGNANYRIFEPTRDGRLALLLLSGHLLEISWGWPLTAVCVSGIVLALATPQLRRPTIWLLCPLVSYYLGFINVILYNYDRFVLPVCLTLALFGGFALDRCLRHSRRSHLLEWRIVTVAGIFLYSLLYAATVDALMLGDSRYVVQRWMRDTLSPRDTVGVSGPRELLPALDCACMDISSLSDLARQQPTYYVLSADYAHAVPTDTAWGRLIAGLEQQTAGYRLVARVRRPSPWPWLPGGHPDLVGPRIANNNPTESDQFRLARAGAFSILRNINPTIEIFRRVRP
jgi:hypothetical protein